MCTLTKITKRAKINGDKNIILENTKRIQTLD